MNLTERARAAVADEDLQGALSGLTSVLRFLTKAATNDPSVAERRERAAAIRRETLADLDGHLAALEERLVALGVTVHHAATREDARRIVVGIARDEGVEVVVKSKSMATEEIELNPALEAAGMEVVETDLGEYIVQLAGEPPSHIVGPALHKRLPEITRLFEAVVGRELPEDADALCALARDLLREKFFTAGMGVTGANFAAADTGTVVLVTNEGNGRLCTTLPRVHVAVVPVEKVIARVADVGVLVPVLTRWATGQALTTYVTMLTGPRREGEVDGPEVMHVVLLDHGRRALVGTPYEEMLACVRCGACLNVCPVYGKIGGHAYASAYQGPMGAVLTPLLSGGTEGRDLPEASSLCGACTEACPVGIPLADMLVRLRADFGKARGFSAWARAWSSPALYRASGALGRLALRARVPVPGWSRERSLPRAPARSFRAEWKRR